MGLAGGHIAEAQAGVFIVHVDAADVVGLAALQHGAVHRPRGDDADDVPLDQALGGGRVLRLLADGHLIALGDQAADIAVTGVVGDAAHGCALILRLAAVPAGQGQIQLLADQLCILVEHLVEVAQAEKEDGVLVLFLDFQVLPHHWGHVCHGCYPLSLNLSYLGRWLRGLRAPMPRGSFLCGQKGTKKPLGFPQTPFTGEFTDIGRSVDGLCH